MKKEIAEDFTAVTGNVVTVNHVDAWEHFYQPFFDEGGTVPWKQDCEFIHKQIHRIREMNEPTAQFYWDKFINLIPDPKTQPNLSQQQQKLNTFERYESLNEIDRSTKLWLDPKQDPRTLTDREQKFLTDNIEKLNAQQKEWLKKVLPKIKNSWSQMFRDHYLQERNTGFESQSAGDRREYYSWMRVNYPKTIDFILQILTAPQSHPK